MLANEYTPCLQSMLHGWGCSASQTREGQQAKQLKKGKWGCSINRSVSMSTGVREEVLRRLNIDWWDCSMFDSANINAMDPGLEFQGLTSGWDGNLGSYAYDGSLPPPLYGELGYSGHVINLPHKVCPWGCDCVKAQQDSTISLYGGQVHLYPAVVAEGVLQGYSTQYCTPCTTTRGWLAVTFNPTTQDDAAADSGDLAGVEPSRTLLEEMFINDKSTNQTVVLLPQVSILYLQVRELVMHLFRDTLDISIPNTFSRWSCHVFTLYRLATTWIPHVVQEWLNPQSFSFLILCTQYGIAIRLVLLSVFFGRLQAVCRGLWVLCAEVGGVSRCGRRFSLVAPGLAEIEPFYCPSDSFNAVTGSVKWSHMVQNDEP